MGVSPITIVLKDAQTPCRGSLCLSWWCHHLIQPSHHGSERGKSFYVFLIENEGNVQVHGSHYFSNTCQSLDDSNAHYKARRPLSAWNGESKYLLGSQGQLCSSMRPFIQAPYNYCRLHKQLWGIQMTNVRQPFKSRF